MLTGLCCWMMGKLVEEVVIRETEHVIGNVWCPTLYSALFLGRHLDSHQAPKHGFITGEESTTGME